LRRERPALPSGSSMAQAMSVAVRRRECKRGKLARTALRCYTGKRMQKALRYRRIQHRNRAR
jgi:hypothetical protein